MAIIFFFRWLIVRIMLGSALIKLRGDSCWRDLPRFIIISRRSRFRIRSAPGFIFCRIRCCSSAGDLDVRRGAGRAVFAFWPRWGRYVAGAMIISFQFTLIVSGNLSFFNWLTILPALACFDDRFWRWLLPTFLTSYAVEARLAAKPSRQMKGLSWVVVVLVGFLSIEPVLNLLLAEPGDERVVSFDTLHLVNTYGAFGAVGSERPVIVFEGTDSADPETATDWKEYPFVGSPWDPKLPPPFIAPYQPHLDWQLWFAAMASPEIIRGRGISSGRCCTTIQRRWGFLRAIRFRIIRRDIFARCFICITSRSRAMRRAFTGLATGSGCGCRRYSVDSPDLLARLRERGVGEVGGSF